MKISRTKGNGKKLVNASTITGGNDKYNDAIRHIHAAIDVLGSSISKTTDNTATKEAIANLSVILFDLQQK